MLDRLRTQLRRLNGTENGRQRSTARAHTNGTNQNGYSVPNIPTPISQPLYPPSPYAVRRGRLLTPVQEAIVDALLIMASVVLAWWLRYELQLILEVSDVNYLSLADYAPFFGMLTIGLLLVFKIESLYDLPRSARWLDEVWMITRGTVVGIAASVVVAFYLRELGYSRLMFLYMLGLIIVLLSTSRMVARLILSRLRAGGKLLEHLLIVGAGAQGLRVMRTVVAQQELGYRVVGFVDDERREEIGRFPNLGCTDDIPTLLLQEKIDQVIIALPSASHNKILEIANHCQRDGVLFRVVPDTYELSLSHVDINELPGVPLISMRSAAITGWNWVIKRAVDILFSGAILLASSPILLITAIAIKLESPGPVIIWQERVGQNGRIFRFYKFRSMRTNAEAELKKLLDLNEASGPIFKIKNDPRRTRVGRIIRKFSIDEIPQFINIFRGDMSLVGPRPALPREVEQYQPWHLRRFEGPGGLTGLWQVSGRSQLTFDEMVMLDIFYIENWSLGLDLKIILRTIPTVLFGRGAY